MRAACNTTTRNPARVRIVRLLQVAILFYTSLTFSLTAVAQEEFVDPPSRSLAKVPITVLTGGVIIVKATLNNFPDSLNFILDTGSSGISLDSATAVSLNLKPGAPSKTIRGVAGLKRVGFLTNQTIKIGKMLADSLDFHVNDYSMLTAVYGEQIDGVIGYSLLKDYVVKINYDSLKLEFCSLGTYRLPKGGFFLRPQIKSLPIQSARVKDERTINARFLYDIGAGLCMLFSDDFVKDSNLLSKKRKQFPKMGEGIGGKVEMHLTVIKEFRLGPYRFRQVPVYVFDDEYNVTSYPQLGGLIGNDILRRFNCVLNYSRNEFYLTPNTHFRDPFDYSYSGLELYMFNGVIEIGEVAKGSPADIAGLKVGDRVIAIGKNISNNLNQYKLELQVEKAVVKMTIQRDGVIMSLPMKLKTIK